MINYTYQLAIVCDKYDMQQVLGLWLDKWIPTGMQVGGKVAGDRWLFIAYVFGRQDLFMELSKDLIRTSTIDAGGSLFAPIPISDTRGSQCSFNYYIPSSILGTWGVRFNFLCMYADRPQRKFPLAANRPYRAFWITFIS